MNEELYQQVKQQYPDLPDPLIRQEVQRLESLQAQEATAVEPTAPVESIRFGAGFDTGVRQAMAMPEGMEVINYMGASKQIDDFEKSLEDYDDDDDVPFLPLDPNATELDIRTKKQWLDGGLADYKQQYAKSKVGALRNLTQLLEAKPEDADIPKSFADAIKSPENFAKYATFNAGQVLPSAGVALVGGLGGSAMLESTLSAAELVDEVKAKLEAETGKDVTYEEVLMRIDAENMRNTSLLASGTAAGSLDLIGLGLVAKATGVGNLAASFMKRGLKDIAKKGFGNVMKSTAKGAAGGALAEAPTEFGQAVFTDFGRHLTQGGTFDDWDIKWEQYLEEGLAAATGGGMLGGGGRFTTSTISNIQGKASPEIKQAVDATQDFELQLDEAMDNEISPEVKAVMDAEASEVASVVGDYASRVQRVLDTEQEANVQQELDDIAAQQAAQETRTAQEQRAVEAVDMMPEKDTVDKLFEGFRDQSKARESSRLEQAEAAYQGDLATAREKEESTAREKAQTRDESKRAIEDTKREIAQDKANRLAEETRIKETDRATKIAKKQDQVKEDARKQDESNRKATDARKQQEAQAVEAAKRRQAIRDKQKQKRLENQKQQTDVSEKTTKQDQGKVSRKDDAKGKSKDPVYKRRTERKDTDKKKAVGRPKLPASETKAYQKSESVEFDKVSPSMRKRIATDPEYAKHKYRKKAISAAKKAEREKAKAERQQVKEQKANEKAFSTARTKAEKVVQKTLEKIGVNNFERSAFNRKTQFRDRVYTDKASEQNAENALNAAMEAARKLDKDWDFTKASALKNEIVATAKERILEKTDPEQFKKITKDKKDAEQKSKEKAAKVLTEGIEKAHNKKGTGFLNLAKSGRTGTISTREGTAIVRRGGQKFFRAAKGTWIDARGNKISDPTLEADYELATEKTTPVTENAETVVNGVPEFTEQDFEVGTLVPSTISNFLSDIKKEFGKLAKAMDIDAQQTSQIEYLNELVGDYVSSLSQVVDKYLQDNNIEGGLKFFITDKIESNKEGRVISGFVVQDTDGSPIIVVKKPEGSLLVNKGGRGGIAFPTAAGTAMVSERNAIRALINNNYVAVHELLHGIDATIRLAIGQDTDMYKEFDDKMKAHWGKAVGALNQMRSDVRKGNNFNKRLYNAVRDYLHFLYPDTKNIMEDWINGTADKDLLMGVNNTAEFFAELANPFFASILKSIRYTNDARLSNTNNVFYRALQSMGTLMGKIFNNPDIFGNINDTLLAAVLNNVDNFYKQTVIDGKVIRQVKGAGGDVMYHSKPVATKIKSTKEQQLDRIVNKIQDMINAKKIHPKTVGLANTIQNALVANREKLDPLKADQLERESLRKFEQESSSENAMNMFYAKLSSFLLQPEVSRNALEKEINSILEDGVNLRDEEVKATNKVKNKLSEQAVKAITGGEMKILLPDAVYNEGDIILYNDTKYEITKGKNVPSADVATSIQKGRNRTDEEKALVGTISKGKITPKDFNIGKLRAAYQKTVTNFFNGIRTMDSLMERMADPAENLYEGPMAIFANMLREAGNEYAKGVDTKAKEFAEMRKKIFGNMSRESVRNMLDQTVDFSFSVRDTSETTVEELNKKYSFGQLIDLYNQLQDESLVARFENEGIDTDSALAQLKETLPKELQQYGDAIRKFYEDYYDSINDIYSKVTGANLDRIKNYTPVMQDAASKNSFETIMSTTFDYKKDKLEDTFNKHMLDRGGITRPVTQDAETVLKRYVMQMERFKAFAIPSDAFANVLHDQSEIRTLLEKKMGTDFLKIVDALANSQITGRMMTNDNWMNRRINAIRNNSVIVALAANLSLLPKQIASFMSYASSMPTMAWAANSIVNPVGYWEGVKLLMKSDYVKKRWNQGFEREFREFQTAIDEFGEIATTESKIKKNKNKLIQALMIPVRVGDIGAIFLGGAPYYLYKYNQYKAQGLSDKMALKKAERDFGKTTDLSQQSTQNMDLSYYQTLPIGRLFTMYQSSPILYLNQVADSIRGAKAHSKLSDPNAKGLRKAAARIFMYQFVLPSAFYMVSSGFEIPRNEEDEVDLEAMSIPLLIGSLTGIPILSALLNLAINKSRGKEFPFRIAPVERDLEKIGKLSDKLVGEKSPFMNEDGEIGGKGSLTTAEWEYWTEDPTARKLVLDVLSFMTRLPISRLEKGYQTNKQWNEGYISDKSKFLQLYLGYSPYAVPSMEEEMQKYRKEREKLGK